MSNESSPIRIFVAYSHKDEPLKVALLEHLSVLEHAHLIDIWTDQRISPGESSQVQVGRALMTADLVLLLLSASFLASDLSRNSALLSAMATVPRRRSLVVPVLLRHCSWRAHPLTASLQPLPKSGHALTSFQGGRRDAAFVEICAAVSGLIAEIRANKLESTTIVNRPNLLSQLFSSSESLEIKTDGGAALPGRPAAEDGAEEQPPTGFFPHVSNTPMEPPPEERTMPKTAAALLREALLESSGAQAITSIDQVTLMILSSDVPEERARTASLSQNPASLGRSESSDFCVLDSSVSKLHASIELLDGCLLLRDLDSTNGTFCNGKPLGGRVFPGFVSRSCQLSHGDVIHLGTARLRVFFYEQENLELGVQRDK